MKKTETIELKCRKTEPDRSGDTCWYYADRVERVIYVFGKATLVTLTIEREVKSPGERLHAAELAAGLVACPWSSYRPDFRAKFEAAARDLGITEGE